jgi:glycine hydroxymethyltransferase
MREPEMAEIAGLVDRVIQNPQNARVLRDIRQQVKALCRRFPIFHTYESAPA